MQVDQRKKDNVVESLAEAIRQFKILFQQKLVDQLQMSFPHKNRQEIYLRCYILNLLLLGDQLVQIRPKIIRMIMSKLITIDSEIKADSHQKSPVLKQKHHKIQGHKDEMSKKLDQLLFILFDYFNAKLSNANSLPEAYVIEIFKELQKVFQETILKNLQSRMIHFIFIFLCSQERYPALQQRFISRLILNINEDDQEPVSKRQRINSIYYLSSLFMRCRGINLTVLYRSIEMLLAYGERELDSIKERSQSQIETYKTHEMLAFLLGNKTLITSQKVLFDRVSKFLIQAHLKLDALNFIQQDILIRLNEHLLKVNQRDVEQLIEITADVISRHYNSESHISNLPSPNFYGSTPMIHDHESHYTRQSLFTSKNKRSEFEMEFLQPFDHFPLIYSEKLLKNVYIPDTDILKDVYPSNRHLSPIIKRRSRDQSHERESQETLVKKIKK